MKIKPPTCEDRAQSRRNITALARQIGPIEFWPIERLQNYANNASGKDVALAEPKSARWKNFNERVAVTNCQSLVRGAMLDQGSFDAAWSWESEKDDNTGQVVIQQDFEAGNAYGGTISSRYDCVVDADHGSRVKQLSIREAGGWRRLL